MLSQIYSSKRNDEGFTLLELLIVVIVIGILAAIALPIFIDQQKVAIDASVKSDVRNTVTNITSAQAQNEGTAKAAISDSGTSVALTAAGREATDSTPTVVIATKGALVLTNVPVLGSMYNVYGWNAGGSKLLGTDSKPGFEFSSITGKFSQANAGAPDGAEGDHGDGAGPVGGGTPVVVIAPPTISTTDAALPDGEADSDYSTLIVAAGDGPLEYKAEGLPAGLSMDKATGEISGTPTAMGTSTVTVTVKNAGGEKSRDYTLAVAKHKVAPNITAGDLPDGTIGASYDQSIAASGEPQPTFQLSDGSLPSGLSLDADGRLHGTANASGTSTFKVTAHNVKGDDTKTFSIYVAPSSAGTSSERVAVPVTDTAYWSRVINGSIGNYAFRGGQTATSNGIVTPYATFISVTKASLPVPASRQIKVSYSGGMTPFVRVLDSNGNAIASGWGDGTWYVWGSGDVVTMPSNAAYYDVAFPNWDSASSHTLSYASVQEQ